MSNKISGYTYTPTQRDYNRIKKKVMKRLAKEQEDKEIMQELLEEQKRLVEKNNKRNSNKFV